MTAISNYALISTVSHARPRAARGTRQESIQFLSSVMDGEHVTHPMWHVHGIGYDSTCATIQCVNSFFHKVHLCECPDDSDSHSWNSYIYISNALAHDDIHMMLVFPCSDNVRPAPPIRDEVSYLNLLSKLVTWPISSEAVQWARDFMRDLLMHMTWRVLLSDVGSLPMIPGYESPSRYLLI
jgi:hypothetical protein